MDLTFPSIVSHYPIPPKQLHHVFGERESPYYVDYSFYGNAAAHNPAPTAIIGSGRYHFQNASADGALYHNTEQFEYNESLVKQEYHDCAFVTSTDQDYEAQAPARSDFNASVTSSDPFNPITSQNTFTRNETIDTAHCVNFERKVDALMRVIQAADCEPEDASSQPLVSSNIPKKKWACATPGCKKRFSYKVYLTTHIRSHTGEKPYVCPKEHCKKSFSQKGNLKAHVNAHGGQKPFSCGTCDKLFTRSGNLRSHEKLHKGESNRFVCILNNCNKSYTQLGNMKTHQNSCHKDALEDLANKFIKFNQSGGVPNEDVELFNYFKQHYNNSNKGIKGRGIGVKLT